MSAGHDIERRLLGTLLCDVDGGYTHTAVACGIDAQKFSIAFHREILPAIHAAAIDGQVGVVEVFRRMSSVEDGKVLADLSAIASEGTSGLHLRDLCELVIGAWRKRMLHRAAVELSEIASGPLVWSEAWTQAGPVLTKASDLAHDIRTETTADVVQRAKEAWVRRMSQPDDAGLSWGISELNRTLGLIRPEFVIIAARPSVGKSTIAAQVASATMRRRNGAPGRVPVFNLETPNDQFIARLATHELQFRIDRAVTKDHIARVLASFDEIGARSNLHVFDKLHDLDRIEAKILTLAAGPGLDLVVVDYVQIVNVAGAAKERREQQVAEVSRRLKLLVNRIGCPIIGIAQLNREVERDGRRPRLSDLRESGALEQDADRVVLLHCDQPPGDSLDAAEIVPTAIIQEKCKDGAKGVAVAVEFNRPLFTFRSLADSDSPRYPAERTRPHFTAEQ